RGDFSRIYCIWAETKVGGSVLIIFNDIFIYSLLLAGLPFAILTSRHTPFQRGVFCNDESIKYPYREDTIPYALLGGIIIPFSIIMIAGESLSVHFNSLQSNSFVGNHYIASIYKAIGAFLFGAAASQSLTDIAKYSIGRLRPHFLAVCDLDWSKINCSDGYIENYICRGNADKVREGRLSFYSGHSSFSMYCMLFTAVSLGGGDVCGGGAGGGAPHAGGAKGKRQEARGTLELPGAARCPVCDTAGCRAAVLPGQGPWLGPSSCGYRWSSCVLFSLSETFPRDSAPARCSFEPVGPHTCHVPSWHGGVRKDGHPHSSLNQR
uniref:Phospholipid phosphatase 1 n=1 Tax=Peromyscus maniculatus bairdii TaxID=230844 RepID=A0A8C8VRT7_PERMB